MNDVTKDVTKDAGQTFPLMAAETPFMGNVNEIPVVIAPPGWGISELEECMPEPRRVKERIQMTCLKSFVSYVLKHKEQSTIIKFETVEDGDITARAVIDYHQAPGDGAPLNGPKWGSHVALFGTKATPAWEEWMRGNERMFKQSTFADFIYQNIKEVKDPAGAELLEILQTLKVTSKGEHKQVEELQGSYEMVSTVKVSTRSDTTREVPLILPKQMVIQVQPFYGGPTITLTADITLQLPGIDGGPVLLGYRFYRLGDALEAMAAEIEEEIKKETKVPVYRCK